MATPDPNRRWHSSATLNPALSALTSTLPLPMSLNPRRRRNITFGLSSCLDAAAKDGDDLLRSCIRIHRSTQSRPSRERTRWDRMSAQERQRGWFISLRSHSKPAIILLAILSSISFATGDPRAGASWRA